MRFQPMDDGLTLDELGRLADAAVRLGVRRVRLTGGEPLVRRDIVGIARRFKDAGIAEISLTTNGQLLAPMVCDLKAAGLNRVNISVDSLKPEVFHRVSRGGDLDTVWQGVEAALEADLQPVKINCVAMRGENDAEAADFAALTIDRPIHVRFIELMPIGGTNVKIAEERVIWRSYVGKTESLAPATDVVTGTAALYIPLSDIRARVEELGPLEPATVSTAGPARNFRLPGAKGTIGFISQVSNTACAACNRMRITPDGMLRPCLMAQGEVDLRTPLRNGATDEQLEACFLRALARKPFEHDLAGGHFASDRTMSQIGG
jgi:cyclic pyranopterin phosphate synthase